MGNKEKNNYVRSRNYQRKKWGDKNNQKDQNSEKAGVIPAGVDYNELTYRNGHWHCYLKK